MAADLVIISPMQGTSHQLGPLLQDLREKRGLRQVDLANLSGVSLGTVVRIEGGGRPFSSNLLAILRVLADAAPLGPDDASAVARLADLDRATLAPYTELDTESTADHRRACEVLFAEILDTMDPKPLAQLLHSVLAIRSSAPRARRLVANLPAGLVRTAEPVPIPGDTDDIEWWTLFRYFRSELPESAARARATAELEKLRANAQ